VTDTAIEERDEAIAEALVAGRSVRSVRKEFNLTLDEIDAIIARTWPVDNRARVRMIMTDLGLLDRLIAEFYQRDPRMRRRRRSRPLPSKRWSGSMI
jgi:hypothetical protein